MATDKIIFSFESEGEQVVIDDNLFSATDYDGLECSDYEIKVNSNTNHMGERVIQKDLRMREIMIDFDYLRWSEVSEMRQKLLRFFHLFRPGVLTVNYLGVERKIPYEVSSFKVNSKNIHEELSCVLYLKCAGALFYDVDITKIPVTTLIGGWKWKFSLPFKMRQFGPLKKNVYNDGHVQTPVEIHLKGPAQYPKLINHRTGEWIRVKRVLEEGETLYINTAFRQKTVEIISGNQKEDAWDYLDTGSSFFWLQVGDNMIEYVGQDDLLKSKGAEIYYSNMYMGI